MYDWEYEEIADALAFAHAQTQLSPGDPARLLASIDRLRAIEAAARDVVAVQPGQDGQVGVEFLDSYRGLICPGCAPYYERGKARHGEGCPFNRLVEALGITDESADAALATGGPRAAAAPGEGS